VLAVGDTMKMVERLIREATTMSVEGMWESRLAIYEHKARCGDAADPETARHASTPLSHTGSRHRTAVGDAHVHHAVPQGRAWPRSRLEGMWHPFDHDPAANPSRQEDWAWMSRM
jgi:hypothetical protein